MTLFHVASILCALVGAWVLGVVVAGYGGLAILLGVIAGLVAGWFIGPLLVFAMFFFVVLFEEGPRSAFDLLRRRTRK